MQMNRRRQNHPDSRLTRRGSGALGLTSWALGLASWALGLVSWAGCAQQQPRELAGQICVPDIGKAEMMALAEDVLGQMHFTIEKADIQTGLMRTRPLSGAQFFEFWRSDNVGPDNSLAANLHTIRRTVELDISGQGEELCIACNVQVQRLSLPEREISSSARAYEMFSRSSPSLQRLALDPQQKKSMAWIDLGNDAQLAEEILRRIETRMVHRTGNEQKVAGDEI